MAVAGESKVAGERSLLVAAGVSAVGIGMYVPFSLVFFHHVTGLSFALVGVVMTATGLAGLAFMPLAGSAVDRFGARRIVLVLYALRALGFALYPFAGSLPAFAAVALVTALADRSFPAVQQSLIGEVARGAARDRLQASLRALQNAGMGAGALIVSGVLALWGRPPSRTRPGATRWPSRSPDCSCAGSARCGTVRAPPPSGRPPDTGWSCATGPSSR